MPVMQATVPPPTQIAPSASAEMCTRPERPRTRALAGRCTARGHGRVPSSHCASEALKLPVTGSSTSAPSFGKNARTSKVGVRAVGARADDADVEVDEAGLDGQHGIGVGEQERDPGRPVVGPRGVHDLAPVDAEDAGDPLQSVLPRPGRSAGAAVRRTRSRARAAAPATSPTAHSCTTRRALRRPAVREPGVARAERRMPRERRLERRREDAHQVVGLGRGRRAARTSSRTGSSSSRSAASPRCSGPCRRARRRADCPGMASA